MRIDPRLPEDVITSGKRYKFPVITPTTPFLERNYRYDYIKNLNESNGRPLIYDGESSIALNARDIMVSFDASKQVFATQTTIGDINPQPFDRAQIALVFCVIIAVLLLKR